MTRRYPLPGLDIQNIVSRRKFESPYHTAERNSQLTKRKENSLGTGTVNGRTKMDFNYCKVPSNLDRRAEGNDEQVVSNKII